MIFVGADLPLEFLLQSQLFVHVVVIELYLPDEGSVTKASKHGLEVSQD